MEIKDLEYNKNDMFINYTKLGTIMTDDTYSEDTSSQATPYGQ